MGAIVSGARPAINTTLVAITILSRLAGSRLSQFPITRLALARRGRRPGDRRRPVSIIVPRHRRMRRVSRNSLVARQSSRIRCRPAPAARRSVRWFRPALVFIVHRPSIAGRLVVVVIYRHCGMLAQLTLLRCDVSIASRLRHGGRAVHRVILWRLRGGVRIPAQQLMLAGFALTACWFNGLSAIARDRCLPTSPKPSQLHWSPCFTDCRAGRGGRAPGGVRLVYGAVGAVLGLQMVADMLPLAAAAEPTLLATSTLLRITPPPD